MPLTRYKRRRQLKSSKKTKRCNKRSSFRRRQRRRLYRGGLPGADRIELYDGMGVDNVPTIDRSNECNTDSPSGRTSCQTESKIQLPGNEKYIYSYNNFIMAANAYRMALINNSPNILELQNNYDNAQAQLKTTFGKNVSAYGKSLTQNQIKHVLAAQRLYNCARPDFVSYSDENRELCNGSPPLPNLINALPFTPTYVAPQNTYANFVDKANGVGEIQRPTL